MPPPKKLPGDNRRGGDITSFFKRAPQPAAAKGSPAGPSPSASRASSSSARHATPSPGIRSPSPELPPLSPSVQGTPSRRPAVTREAVIAASDDDDGDGRSSGDDDLEDLMAKFDPRRNAPPGAAAARPGGGHRPAPYETPRAKRKTSSAVLSSPLTINPKHQFDMRALARDALLDDATRASSLRNKEAAEAAAASSAAAAAAAAASAEASSRDESDAFLGIVQDRGGADAHKVLRAVQRAAPGQSQLRYCFFNLEYTTPPELAPPKLPKSSPWRLLAHGSYQAREQHLASGLPQALVSSMGELPEELFEWILDDLCVQRSAVVQHEYVSLLSWCPDHARARLTPARLKGLFLRLGASEELEISEGRELTLTKSHEEPYEDRDWACLRSFIELLGLLSKDMPLESVTYAIQTLLRMSMDRFLICSVDILVEYEDAMQLLLHSIPDSSWDSFCEETGRLLYATFGPQCIRINALMCLPVSSRPSHELRRRLAVAFLFRDPALAGRHPDTVVNLRGVIDRLGDDDFAVTPKTDFDELRACVVLLNVAVDDGSFLAAADGGAAADAEAEKRFNAEVDELATRLRGVWRRINDTGMKLSRTEAKSVIEWVQQRLSHSVRTRRAARRSVFDDVPPRARDDDYDDPFLPRQQSYMRNFLGKPLGKKTKAAGTPPVSSGAGSPA